MDQVVQCWIQVFVWVFASREQKLEYKRLKQFYPLVNAKDEIESQIKRTMRLGMNDDDAKNERILELKINLAQVELKGRELQAKWAYEDELYEAKRSGKKNKLSKCQVSSLNKKAEQNYKRALKEMREFSLRERGLYIPKT